MDITCICPPNTQIAKYVEGWLNALTVGERTVKTVTRPLCSGVDEA